MSRAQSARKTHRRAHRRRSAQGPRQARHEGTDGSRDALLLGHELRRNCGCPGRSPPVCRRGAAAGAPRIAAGAGRKQRHRRRRSRVNETEMNRDNRPDDPCVDEMTLLLYVERQLDREAAQGVSLHTQTCTRCLTLLRALDRESRLLTRSMLEQDEPLPARLAEFHEQVKRNMQWIWGVVFGLAVLGVYALYTGYIEPWQRQFEQAGFTGSDLVSLALFQGAFWKGWQSMFTLFEALAVMIVIGFGLFAFRRYLRRGSAMAMLFASLVALLVMTPPASATEFRKGDNISIPKGEVVKGDIFITGEHVRIEGEVEGDVYVFAQQLDMSGHIRGDLIGFVQSERVSGA